jgi:hypothetical protein
MLLRETFTASIDPRKEIIVETASSEWFLAFDVSAMLTRTAYVTAYKPSLVGWR